VCGITLLCGALWAGESLVFVLGGCRLRVVSLPCWLSSPRRFLALLCGFGFDGVCRPRIAPYTPLVLERLSVLVDGNVCHSKLMRDNRRYLAEFPQNDHQLLCRGGDIHNALLR